MLTPIDNPLPNLGCVAMESEGLLIRVYGDVQGVGFRMFIKRLAEQLGVKGYVRNLIDGSVEIFVEGEGYLIRRFVEELRLNSPTEIADMVIENAKPRGFESFYVVP